MSGRTKIVFDEDHSITVDEPLAAVVTKLSESSGLVLFTRVNPHRTNVDVYVNGNQIAYLEPVPARKSAEPTKAKPRRIDVPPPISEEQF